jgi:hypothetical protein
LYRRVLPVAPQTMRPEDGDWQEFRYLDNNYDSDMATAPVDDATDDNGVVDAADLGGVPFYSVCDVSARPEWDSAGNVAGWVPNSLDDLTKRECRFAHAVRPEEVSPPSIAAYPFPISAWGQLGLPTLRECSHPNWMSWPDRASLPGVTPVSMIDLWNYPHPWVDTTTTPPTPEVDRETGTLLPFLGPRIAEDVILTNVIGFDVKVWDPGAPVLRAVDDNNTPLNLGDDSLVRYDYNFDGTPETPVLVVQGDPGFPLALAHLMEEWAKPPGSRNGAYLPVDRGSYVDLGYPEYTITTYGVPWSFGSTFSGTGHWRSGLSRVYDTWSIHYEHDGLDQDGDGIADEGVDGFDSPGNGLDDDGNGVIDDADDPGNGIVDDLYEYETSPPYPAPLHGIQVKIRTFEPDSRQVREVTVVVNFSEQ